ncbi:hypothetical protein VMCG_03400 [Cytospora schulzeri]|uniref:IQ domain-containing protein IQM6 n=1 Tax=Cytospora schulzeri TaxID=448051 RepID=A0A423WWS8_9PEZI|nr:hypothetical protein VMCG_03400 [Valsa malicola]
MTEETTAQAHATSRRTTSSAISPHDTPGQTNALPTPPQTPSIAEANGLDKDVKYFDNMEGQTGQDTETPSTRSKKEYMDSLVPPSSEEISRISQVQLVREQKEKRKSRERAREQRKSMEVSRSSLDVETTGKPQRSGIFGRHKKADSAPSHPRNSTITAAAVASAKANGTTNGLEDIPQHRAATLIQRTYRGYRTRREMKGLGLDADTRWTHAMRELQFREVTKPRARSEDGPLHMFANATGGGDGTDTSSAKRSNPARYNWRKATVIAKRAGADMDDDSSSSSSDSDDDQDSALSTPEKKRAAHQKREEAKVKRRNNARVMGLQYFLEMVDLKHRYGSNLRQYHEQWKQSSTKQNFFYWLDQGEGRNVELATCPRERLERERVRYLSREERQYYLAMVDSEGRLCWAKNGHRIDTTEKWKDSIHGIVPSDDPTPAYRPTSASPNQPKLFPRKSSDGASDNSAASESELEAARAAKYASPGFSDAKGVKKVTHVSASTIFNTLLRKSVRKNTWIFVADTSFRLYVGIKDSGAFQHSSFLQGSRISAAGLIKIKNGRLTSLSPLSGHYRPPASNFRAFVRSLKEEGVDTSHVSISKSYAVLVGLEMYVRTQQKGKRLLQKATHKKDKVVHPEEVQKREEDARDKSQSAEKERRFLEKQAKDDSKLREENKAAMKVIHKLGMSPTVPEGQRGETQAEAEAEGGPSMPTLEEGKTTK